MGQDSGKLETNGNLVSRGISHRKGAKVVQNDERHGPVEPSPALQQLTEFNREALRYYTEACRILALPFDQRREAIGEDERLAEEVTRVHEYRRGK